jgi:asparagine synthase (glutamine-hydrolysing)
MCGICGIIRFDNKSVEEFRIKEMMRIMKHRGPDDEGLFIDNNVGFGFVRLSIIDLSAAGHQPMFSEDNRYVIVFNGEIYNYLELREDLKVLGHTFKTNTDTEVLLAAYIEWEEACLDRFNGMWAFAIYDTLNKTIFAARDRFGIKPFYYIQNAEFFAFASEIPPLLSLVSGKPTPDYQTIFDYLAFNRTDQTERTFFNEVKKLQHGNCFSLATSTFPPSGGIKGGKEWYNLRSKVSCSEGFSSPQEFRELLTSSISLRLRSDVPVGVCFSGGLDSSSIVSVLLKDFDIKDLNTFSAVYKKGQKGDESEFISEYRSYLKSMFYVTPDAETLQNDLNSFVKAHGEPIPSTSPYAQFKVMELAKGNAVVTLDGQGADEEMGGYHYFFGFYFKDLFLRFRLFKLIREIYYYTRNHKSLYGIKAFMFFLLPKRLRTYARVKRKGYLVDEFVREYGESNNITGNIYGSKSLNDSFLDHFEYKLEHLLKWEDRNSMWFSLEARVPFLDYRLVERLLATNPDMIINHGMTKHILRESMIGILPEKIRMRADKTGFGTPQDEWFRTKEWGMIILGILNGTSFKQRNLINCDAALSQFNKHVAGTINISNEIWKWVHLELWFREYID